MQQTGLTVLYQEHLQLGVSFGEQGVPLHYGLGADTLDRGMPESNEVMLADLTQAPLSYVGGSSANAFVHMACAGAIPAVGECFFEPVLTGDGGLASIPLLARTGDEEFILLDASPRSAILDGWLTFLSNVSQDGVSPFEGLQLEDATGSHVVLALWGERSYEVLCDYAQEFDLPKRGEVRSCFLDAIPCILAQPDLKDQTGFLILIPPQFGVAIWRSLLSFTFVIPKGRLAMNDFVTNVLPWASWLKANDTLRVDAAELEGAGLLRTENDFVGARGLRQDI